MAPHIAIHGGLSKNGRARKTSIPAQVAASGGYANSQRERKRIEEIFGWETTVGGLDQLMVRNLAKVQAVFVFTCAAYNVIRLPKLLAAAGEVCLAA